MKDNNNSQNKEEIVIIKKEEVVVVEEQQVVIKEGVKDEKYFQWDTLLGKHIRYHKDHINTIDHITNVEFIGLYFSAFWCPPCKTFTPQLIDFYYNCNSNNTTNTNSKTINTKINSSKVVEIIYIPSDRNNSEYEKYYNTMPWYSIGINNPTIKQSLAKLFHVNSIPTLIVLDCKTGLFITNTARHDIMHIKDYQTILNKWRSIKPVSIEISLSTASSSKSLSNFSTIEFLKEVLYKYITNPLLYIGFGMYYFIKIIYYYSNHSIKSTANNDEL